MKNLVWTGIVAAAVLVSSASVCAQSSGRAAKGRQAGKARPSAKSNAAFDEAAKRADEARLAGRLDEAIAFYLQALQARPTWAEGWWYAGAILYEKDRYVEARNAFRNLVALDAKKGTAWGMLGLCEFQTREYDRAIISLQRGRLLGLGGNQELAAVVRYHAAILYIRLEQFELAYDILREFVREGNESPKVVEAFGLTMLRMPFLPSEIPPDKREQVLLAGRAGFNLAARRMDESRKAFDELLARYPEAPNVHYAFGIYLLNQDADAALEEFRRELKISPSHVPAMLQIAFEYLKRNEHETALPWAEKSVQLAPNLFPARNVLGRVLLELGQVERAIKELEAGVKLAPDSPEMHYALARAYTRAGRKADAAREREIFQRLEKLLRAQREGPQAVGGAEAGTGEKPPDQKP
ncbi:MAG TPA: tetratricopeptide repeat protein [Blastocatellia bacterium]|nr:tetratricopeptide repeat protein [Blastocatellia bacterium]